MTKTDVTEQRVIKDGKYGNETNMVEKRNIRPCRVCD